MTSFIICENLPGAKFTPVLRNWSMYWWGHVTSCMHWTTCRVRNHLPTHTVGIFPGLVQCTHLTFNTLRPRQDGCHFPDNILKWIFFNENLWISIKISLKFVPRDPINNIPALVQIMAWCWPGDKPLSQPMLVSLLTHISHFAWMNFSSITQLMAKGLKLLGHQ